MANNNRYARQNESLSSKRNLSGEEKVTIDAQLARLEEDLRKLKIEYDIFFSGGAKRAPYDTKNRVETTVKRLGDERSLTFAQRYLYNSLVARYTAFKEVWRRTMKGREEGRDAIAAAQAQAALHAAQTHEPPSQEKQDSRFVCGDVQAERETVKKIYNALLEAKKTCGERTEDFAFEHFERQLIAQTERFKTAANCARVSFEVGAADGRVVFKAKAEK